MPPQHIEIAETAAALRRKLRRERETAQVAPAQFATNRGNKLRPGARYVHAGSLPYKQGKSYKQTVNHAGYQRYILERNPKRFNGYGDELDDSESDADADADAEEENAYGEVRIEDLLRPLIHPSELAAHPTMSIPYLDSALPEMVSTTDAKIREERNNLWRAKNLYRYFTGDESWIPSEQVEDFTDWDLFEPNPGFTDNRASKRRRLNGDHDLDGDVQIVDAVDEGYKDAHEQATNGILEALQRSAGRHATEDGSEGKADQQEQAQETDDLSMAEIDALPSSEAQTNGLHKQEGRVDGQPREQPEADAALLDAAEPTEPKTETDVEPVLAPRSPTRGDQIQDSAMQDGSDHHDEDGDNDEDRPSTASTPPPPPRRITRALAAEHDTNSNAALASPPPTSPTLSSLPQSPSQFEPHPLFLLPASLTMQHQIHPNYPPLSISLAHSGLPPEELLETRKLLSLYIQKSEETLRGLEAIYGKLVKAKRRRDRVYAWCVAEGHVNELSDGEDWIDAQAWGLSGGELRKGRDEDGGGGVVIGENGVAAATAEGGGEEGTTAAVVMGGRKAKRRGRAKD